MSEPEAQLGRRITLWTALCGLVGGLLGGGAEGLLKWLEFHEHLSEVQQNQILEVVKLATDLDKNKVQSAVDYVTILAEDLPKSTKERLLIIVARSATSGPTVNPQAVAQITATFTKTIDSSDQLKSLIMPGHPRLFIQISRDEQRAETEKLRQKIATWNVEAPGVELVSRYSGPTELRYFFPEDADQAAKLAHQLGESLPSLTSRLIGGYTQKAGIKPELFELWIGPQSMPGSSSGSGGANPPGPKQP